MAGYNLQMKSIERPSNGQVAISQLSRNPIMRISAQPTLDYYLLRYRDHIAIFGLILMSYTQWKGGEVYHVDK